MISEPPASDLFEWPLSPLQRSLKHRPSTLSKIHRQWVPFWSSSSSEPVATAYAAPAAAMVLSAGGRKVPPVASLVLRHLWRRTRRLAPTTLEAAPLFVVVVAERTTKDGTRGSGVELDKVCEPVVVMTMSHCWSAQVLTRTPGRQMPRLTSEDYSPGRAATWLSRGADDAGKARVSHF